MNTEELLQDIDFEHKDEQYVVQDLSASFVGLLLEMATRDMPIKQGIIAADIMKIIICCFILFTSKEGKCSSQDDRMRSS